MHSIMHVGFGRHVQKGVTKASIGAIYGSPVDKGTDFLQLGLLAAEEAIRVGHVVDVELGQPDDAGPLPIVVAQRIIPQP